MLAEKTKKANVAAAVWFISLFALFFVFQDGGNIWDEGDVFGIAVFSVHGISFFVGLWYYAKAKGYPGILGVGLGFLFYLGGLILLLLPDKTQP